MIPPTIEPPRPSATVAYHGIGSGPGSAQRASPPTMKPPTISEQDEDQHTRASLREAGTAAGHVRGPAASPIAPTSATERRRSPKKRPTSATRMTATMMPTMNCSKPLEKMSPAIDERRDPDQDGHDPAHRVGARVEEPPERADEGADDDQQYPVHAILLFRLSREKRPRAASVADILRTSLERRRCARGAADFAPRRHDYHGLARRHPSRRRARSATTGGRGWRRREADRS